MLALSVVPSCRCAGNYPRSESPYEFDSMSKDCNPSLFRLSSDRLVELQLKAEAFLFGNSLASSFVRGASWSLAGAILGRGLTFVATIIAARTLGNTTYGELG